MGVARVSVRRLGGRSQRLMGSRCVSDVTCVYTSVARPCTGVVRADAVEGPRGSGRQCLPVTRSARRAKGEERGDADLRSWWSAVR